MMESRRQKERALNYYIDKKQLHSLTDKIRELPSGSPFAHIHQNQQIHHSYQNFNTEGNLRNNHNQNNYYSEPHFNIISNVPRNVKGTPTKVTKIRNNNEVNGNGGNYNYDNNQHYDPFGQHYHDNSNVYNNGYGFEQNKNNRITWNNLDNLNFYDFKSNGRVNFNPNNLLVDDDESDHNKYFNHFNRNVIVDEKSFQNKYSKYRNNNDLRNSHNSRNSYYSPNGNGIYAEKRDTYANTYNPSDIKSNLEMHRREIIKTDPNYEDEDDSRYFYNKLRYNSNVQNTINKAQKVEKLWEDKRTKVI